MNQVPRRVISRNRRRNPRRNPRRIFTSILKAMLLLMSLTALVGAGTFLYYFRTSNVFHDTVTAIATRSDTPEKAFPGRSEVNLLVMGRDEDRDKKDRVLHRTKGRTDAIMLAHVDFRNKTANILSIPRDTLVRIPGYRGKRRINTANALGGPDLAQRTIEDFLGISPDYYILMNFDGFAKAIDSVGGISLTVDKQLDYDDSWGNLHIHLTPGFQKLSGTQAMGFVRYRHSNAGGGDSDFIRIRRQQALIAALKGKLSNPSVMVKIPGMLDGMKDDVNADLTTSQMVCIARFMKSLPPGTGIHMATIPSEKGSRIYVKADLDATRELVDQMFRTTQ